jgi:hypothetical protein
MVTFNVGDKSYRLEFERKKENVTLFKGKRERHVTSLYPYTIARLLQIVPGASPLQVATAKVGCHPGDRYSHAKGRLYALKTLTLVLNYQYKNFPEFLLLLKSTMWDAYTTRLQTVNKKPQENPPVASTAPVIEGVVLEQTSTAVH